jgi:hypothetical protein
LSLLLDFLISDETSFGLLCAVASTLARGPYINTDDMETYSLASFRFLRLFHDDFALSSINGGDTGTSVIKSLSFILFHMMRFPGLGEDGAIDDTRLSMNV